MYYGQQQYGYSQPQQSTGQRVGQGAVQGLGKGLSGAATSTLGLAGIPVGLGLNSITDMFSALFEPDEEEAKETLLPPPQKTQLQAFNNPYIFEPTTTNLSLQYGVQNPYGF
tara:strand:- start:1635 stop:1970 length:336 start_codon:yes stop_codon:yes gene_type:complete